MVAGGDAEDRGDRPGMSVWMGFSPSFFYLCALEVPR